MDHDRRSVWFDGTLNMICSLSRGRFRLPPSTLELIRFFVIFESGLNSDTVWIILQGSYCIAKKVDGQWIFEHALRYVHWKFGKKCRKFQPITQNRMTWWTMVNHEDLCQPHLTNHIMNWKWPYYTQILTALQHLHFVPT